MKTTMTPAGIGPKLMILSLPYVILSIIVMYKIPEFLNIDYFDNILFKNLGIIWFATGITFWISSVIIFLRDFKSGKLITRGTYGLCRNPIYASMIIFIIPSLAVIFHSGLIFSIGIVFYLGFKFAIHGENILLKRKFGDEYENYKKSVNEMLPFPLYLFKKNHKIFNKLNSMTDTEYVKRVLMSSGMLAVILYLVHVVVGGLLWNGYNHLQQPISDLTSTGAPNREMLQLIAYLYGVLALLFAISFTISESKKRQKLVFIGGIFFVMMHVISILYGFFPQDLPGSNTTFAGTMHLIVTALIVPFTILTPLLIGVGYRKEQYSKSFGKYSIVTGILIFIFGGLSAVFFINKLPYFGLIERLNIGVLQIWTFCLSYKLSFTK